MTKSTFATVFTQFLNGYWGAFHEALEAQSVTPSRLAGSLFKALQSEHRAFEAMYAGPAEGALDSLGDVWRELEARRYQSPDPGLTHDEITQARRLFEQIYTSLVREGHKFPALRKTILQHAPHSTPKAPLRTDAAR